MLKLYQNARIGSGWYGWIDIKTELLRGVFGPNPKKGGFQAIVKLTCRSWFCHFFQSKLHRTKVGWYIDEHKSKYRQYDHKKQRVWYYFEDQ